MFITADLPTADSWHTHSLMNAEHWELSPKLECDKGCADDSLTQTDTLEDWTHQDRDNSHFRVRLSVPLIRVILVEKGGAGSLYCCLSASALRSSAR